MVSKIARSLVLLSACVGLAACALDGTEATADEDDAVTVDTSTPLARAQYDANVAFAQGYVARCKPQNNGHKRAIVTGFGRFLYVSENATGRVVSTLVPAAKYPATKPPASTEVDPPGPQTSVAVGTVHLPHGDVDVCAMILPVYWDLAAILVAKEVDAFGPDMVLMNGVADTTQDLWIELGSINRAMHEVDGSDRLVPIATGGRKTIPLVPTATSSDLLRGQLMSWRPVEDAARAAVTAHGADVDEGRRFDEVLTGAKLAGFPRAGNTYLCNNVTYLVNYLMGYSGQSVTLLKASVADPKKPNGVRVRIARDVRKVPRTFLHWPSSLSGKHLADGAAVLGAVIDAQLSTKTAATTGNNAMAEIQASGGTF
jgi:hypothetical protein